MLDVFSDTVELATGGTGCLASSVASHMWVSGVSKYFSESCLKTCSSVVESIFPPKHLKVVASLAFSCCFLDM